MFLDTVIGDGVLSFCEHISVGEPLEELELLDELEEVEELELLDDELELELLDDELELELDEDGSPPPHADNPNPNILKTKANLVSVKPTS